MSPLDAVVVGSGPNGLAAAITLARAGHSVEVYEGARTPGGGCRTEELTLPGFHHDVCSAVHPLLLASPFFQADTRVREELVLCTPKVAFAHPLDRGRAASVVSSVEETARSLGADKSAYERLFSPLVAEAASIAPEVLSSMRSIPSHPLTMARFGLNGLLSARQLAQRFQQNEAKALLAGVSAHSMLPLTAPLSGGFGLFLAMTAHFVGWPVVEGGTSKIIDALVRELESLGGKVITDRWIQTLRELPPSRSVLLDVSPRQFLDLAGDQLPPRARSSLARFRYGPGICKVDWALDEPVPWSADVCRETATVHLGGSFQEIQHSEAEVAAGRHPNAPYVIVTQPSVIDPTRAPEGKHTLWAYCHVPSGSSTDMTSRIEAQIERFAPGFKDVVQARFTTTAVETEHHNPNYIGGDINGGTGTLRQTVFRPTPRWNPYRTALHGVYLCSASTPPGGGVHGMCGDGAARTVLKDLQKTTNLSSIVRHRDA